jgi:hypothetical protein
MSISVVVQVSIVDPLYALYRQEVERYRQIPSWYRVQYVSEAHEDSESGPIMNRRGRRGAYRDASYYSIPLGIFDFSLPRQTHSARGFPTVGYRMPEYYICGNGSVDRACL